ncbi:MAG: glycerol-3-phosphate 1-O-acyltransferase PlsY [Candidatus Omnitrophica bacterium]|nr:glycerol-3-phosphate 1-O-acyltransferase PlsY [Candidatus Omnitrophota bacterium]
MLLIITGIITSYLVGSIPTAYLFVRILKGEDIRRIGSGNVGATNASRILGKKLGFLILGLDILKGVIPTVFLADIICLGVPYAFNTTLLRIALGLCCICGHNWPVFLKFKGGKGVATTIGVLLGFAVKIHGLWQIFGLVILSWVVIFAITKIVSAASILAALSLPVFVIIAKQSHTILFSSLLISGLIILRHSPNIKRLVQGKEPRFNFKKTSSK